MTECQHGIPLYGFCAECCREIEQEIKTQRSQTEMTSAAEHAKNIRRNIKHIHTLLTPGDDRDSQLIDLANHIDTLAQQIERRE